MILYKIALHWINLSNVTADNKTHMLSSNSSYQAGESSFFSIARLYIGDCFAKTLNRRSEQRVGHQTHTLSTGKISTMLLQNQAITYICQLRQTCMP